MSRRARSSGGTILVPQNGGDTLGGGATLRGATSVTAASCWPDARSAPAITIVRCMWASRRSFSSNLGRPSPSWRTFMVSSPSKASRQ